jgi:hypothetical protein
MWRVLRNSDPRLPPIQVLQAIVGRPAPASASVIWEGEAASREDAWGRAGEHDSSLKALPLPNPFDSGSVFARVRPKKELDGRRNGKPKPKWGPSTVTKTNGHPKPAVTSEPSQKARVLEFIMARGTEGATDDEIETALGLKHQSASARRNELARESAIVSSGLHRKTTSGDEATVWVIKPPRVKRPVWSDEAMRDAVKNSYSIQEALQRLKYTGAHYGAVYDWVREPVLRLGLDTEHWSKPMRQKRHGSTKGKGSKSNKEVELILAAITGFMQRRGADGATNEEVVDYVTKHGDFNHGTVQSRFSDLKKYSQFAVLKHPEGLTRVGSGNKSPEVYTYREPRHELLAWAKRYEGLKKDPEFTALFLAIKRLAQPEVQPEAPAS